MGKIFYLMGKSSSGKDTLYEKLLDHEACKLHPILLYTTRPIRTGETDGVQYHFVDEKRLRELDAWGKVIEIRSYDTMCGVWKYFTVDDGTIDLCQESYLAIGTLESYHKMRNYYGKENLIPLYVEVEDGIRLKRAISREEKQEHPNYEEMCRRFLADARDFSEERIKEAEIFRRFLNNGAFEECLCELLKYIKENDSAI